MPSVAFRNGGAVFEGKAGEGQALGCLHIEACPDERVLSCASISKRATYWIWHEVVPFWSIVQRFLRQRWWVHGPGFCQQSGRTTSPEMRLAGSNRVGTR